MSGATLDSGALIGLERGNRTVLTHIRRARTRGEMVSIPAGVVAQVWRDGARQVGLSHLLSSPGVEVVPLDDFTARAVGQICGLTRTRDIVDASVVFCARRRGHLILTSDPDDLLRIDPDIELVVV